MSTKSFNLSTSYSVKSAQTTIVPNLVVGLLTKTIFFSGYIEGYRQPTGLISLWVEQVNSLQLKNLQRALEHYFSAYPIILKDINSEYDIATCFGEGLCALQKAAGFPIFEAIQIKSTQASNEFQLIVPMQEESILLYLIDFMLEFFNRNALFSPDSPDKVLILHLEGLINRLSAYAPKGSNSLRFLQAAHSNSIPWMYVEQNVFQFGYGVHSRWFDSTFTDKTSVISTAIARNKFSTAMLLRKAGLPVPEQYLVSNETEAVNLARKIGYPVVVKPLNEDGGRAVYARLMSDEAVKKAYQIVQNHSSPVLLEKHIMGKDYRLQILNGELIWAIERIPAGITGDGKSSIGILIHEFNKQKGNQVVLLSKSGEISEEVIVFLAEQGYVLDSVLKTGQFIPIVRIANISAGGTPVGVLDKVHPDNKRLAETAANLLRLDIAGIDLIMPDIQQSYLKTAAAIIEVNAQPQLGIITAPHIYKDILLKFLPEQGRIPIVVVFGDSANAAFIENIQLVLLSQCRAVGVAEVDGARINGEYIASTESLFIAGKSLLLNKTVDALIYHVKSMEEVSMHGLPFDAFDYLFFFNEPVSGKVKTNSDWVVSLLKACRGPVITTEDVLNYLMDFAAAEEVKLAVTFNEEPQKGKQYPAFIDAVSYFDERRGLLIRQMNDANKNQSFDMNQFSQNISTQEQLLLSLGLYYRIF